MTDHAPDPATLGTGDLFVYKPLSSEGSGGWKVLGMVVRSPDFGMTKDPDTYLLTHDNKLCSWRSYVAEPNRQMARQPSADHNPAVVVEGVLAGEAADEGARLFQEDVRRSFPGSDARAVIGELMQIGPAPLMSCAYCPGPFPCPRHGPF